MSRLPNDVCRCFDSTCPKRETCLRWLDRSPEGERWVTSANTLRHTNGECYEHIPVDDDRANHLLGARPCPFCGHKDPKIFVDWGQGRKYGGVQCGYCEAIGPLVRTNYKDNPWEGWVRRAVAEWNDRTGGDQ